MVSKECNDKCKLIELYEAMPKCETCERFVPGLVKKDLEEPKSCSYINMYIPDGYFCERHSDFDEVRYE